MGVDRNKYKFFNSDLFKYDRNQNNNQKDVVFILPNELSKDDYAFLAVLLSCYKNNPIFLELYGLFKDDFLMFLSIFSGRKVHIPRLGTVNSLIKKLVIYSYLNKGGFSEEVFERASKKYSVQKKTLYRLVNSVEMDIHKFKGKKWKI